MEILVFFWRQVSILLQIKLFCYCFLVYNRIGFANIYNNEMTVWGKKHNVVNCVNENDRKMKLGQWAMNEINH